MYIGIDMGGTKVSALVLDRTGRECLRLRHATPTSYAQTVELLTALVAELEEAVGRRGLPVGLGLPGVVDPAAGTVRAVNLPWLLGRPLGADLADALGRAVPMANDANCFVLSEAVDGGGARAPVVFGAVLGTGVGGGIAVHGKALFGAHGVAGEWGHTPLPWRTAEDGPELLCPCGKKGCIETMLSGSGLAYIYNNLSNCVGSAEEVGRMAVTGDETARKALSLYFSALARALASVVNFLDPDTIVVGGGLSGLPDIIGRVSLLWRGLSLVPEPRTRLVRAVHGADSGVRGAAWLARQAGEGSGPPGGRD